MPDGEPEIAYCHACGTSMDVSQVAPFSNVECPSCAQHTRVKREFGPYTILRRHAIGGMSVVFIANDNTLGREVVVKILNEEYGCDERRIGAFEEEARITASFSHPHVVRVFTTGRAFGRFYIAMELVGGGHFEHHIRERGSIPEKELLPIAIQVADGLKAAHSAGLIHRDVKPGNILLDASGNAKIVDFGLALVTKGGKAKATEIWATPYYVPPETIEGLPEDFRSDIYAFGATVYHALAGKPPCDEESMDTNKLREAKRRILPLAKAAPWISPDTCAAVDRTMAHDPEQRFRSYNDLLSALETARQRLGNGYVPDPAAGQGRRAAAGKKDKMALAGASLLVVAALTFGMWWISRPNDAAAKGTASTLLSTPKSTENDRNAENAARVGTAYREAGATLRSGEYAKARGMFASVRDDAGVLEPTGSWAACEAVLCSYLEGRTSDAKIDAKAAIEHLEKAEGIDESVRHELMQALDRLRNLRPVTRSMSESVPTGPGLMAALIHGLKDWEQGLPDEAKPHFEAVMSIEPKGADTWVEPYQKIISGYLADYQKLVAADPGPLPDTADACHRLADELHAIYGSLQTKGRARFNIRSLQLDLEKRARMLESGTPAPLPVEEPPVEVKPAGDPLAAARSAAAECRFAEAAAMLKGTGFTANAKDERNTATLLLAEAAEGFLSDLEEKLQASPADLPITLRDFTKLKKITGAHHGGVTALDEEGNPHEVAWVELSPDSMILLHRSLIKEESSELERLRRNEQAIAFDLLAGNPDRGKEAATVLAARSPAFKRRWDLFQPALR